MKDEIPQSVIDSHVKNAAKARAEKAKQENSEESKGRVKNAKRVTNANEISKRLPSFLIPS